MAKSSQNGWPALSTRNKIHTWIIPTNKGRIELPLRNGSAGFILAYLTLRMAETVEPITDVSDDWGYAYRDIRGSKTLSNHASGTAVDINATKHPLGKSGTFTKAQTALIHGIINGRYLKRIVRWGGDYSGRKDEMHFELICDLTTAEQAAKYIATTSRGKRILSANPGQWKVIIS